MFLAHQNGSKINQKIDTGPPFFSIFFRASIFDPFLSSFGSPLAPCGSPLAPFGSLLVAFGSLLALFWFPSAPFWRALVKLWRPLAPFQHPLGSILKLSVTLFNFYIGFSYFPAFFAILWTIQLKRSDFWIWHPSHSRFLPLPCFFTSNFEENPHTTDSTPIENK